MQQMSSYRMLYVKHSRKRETRRQRERDRVQHRNQISVQISVYYQTESVRGQNHSSISFRVQGHQDQMKKQRQIRNQEHAELQLIQNRRIQIRGLSDRDQVRDQ